MPELTLAWGMPAYEHDDGSGFDWPPDGRWRADMTDLEIAHVLLNGTPIWEAHYSRSSSPMTPAACCMAPIRARRRGQRSARPRVTAARRPGGQVLTATTIVPLQTAS